jgi:hypothetical protein
MIGFIDTSLQIQTNIAAHNQSWPPRPLFILFLVLRLTLWLTTPASRIEFFVMIDGPLATPSWNKAPIWDLYCCQTVACLVIWGALSDKWTGLSFNFCWSSPAQSFSGPSPLRLATIFYCLRFETANFVASYDSQSYVGGILLRLHTGVWLLPKSQSQSDFTTSGLPPINSFCRQVPWDSRPDFLN